MSRELREELLRRTAKARARHGAGAGSPDRDPAARQDPGGGRDGAPGLVFVLEESGGHPVEWAVLEVLSEKRCLAVPLDDQPLVGSVDVAVRPLRGTGNAADPEPGLRAPSVLRCAFAAELERRWLIQPTGRIPAESVKLALERVRRLEAGSDVDGPVGSAIGREVETEPEYLDWIAEVVEPATGSVKRALEASRFTAPRRLVQGPAQAAPEPPSADSSGAASGVVPPIGRGRSRHQLWAIAASLLLVTSAVLGWQLLRFQGTQQEALRKARAPIEELERQNAELEQRLADVHQEPAPSDPEPADTEATEQQTTSAVDRALEALVNVPLAVLAAGVRGEPEIVQVSAEDSWVGLVVELEPDQTGPFVLELSPLGGGAVTFRADGLVPSRGLLSILVPSAELPPAAYRLRLLADGRNVDLTLTLIVERP